MRTKTSMPMEIMNPKTAAVKTIIAQVRLTKALYEKTGRDIKSLVSSSVLGVVDGSGPVRILGRLDLLSVVTRGADRGFSVIGGSSGGTLGMETSSS